MVIRLLKYTLQVFIRRKIMTETTEQKVITLFKGIKACEEEAFKNSMKTGYMRDKSYYEGKYAAYAIVMVVMQSIFDFLPSEEEFDEAD
jgi:hypothetical protein